MIKKINKIFAFLLVIALMFSVVNVSSLNTAAETHKTSLKMTQGTIDSGAGEIMPFVNTRLYTQELLSLDDFEAISVAKGYKVWIHYYDINENWVSSFGWREAINDCLEVTVSKSTNIQYFRVVVGTLNNDVIVPASFPEKALTLIEKTKIIPEFTFENVFEIGKAYNGPWQEGAIFDGKLFMLNHAEEGVVMDIETGNTLGDFKCNTEDFFSVHSNSMCFGTEFYDKNDKYPLLYLSVYNNYGGHANQYEGHCGVYRIIENESDFYAELVQVIKIGFVDDLDLWKSLPNNGDVCEFGNFIVDTDNNDLYAYVMRDATQTTRYYKFDLPKANEGVYDSLFECNVVTLNTIDIKDSFDTEYSVYLQGADYLDGMILSSSGLGHGRDGGAILRLVDLKTKKVVKLYDTFEAGVYNEPEVIAVDPETKKVYYGSTDGQLRWLTCIDKFREERNINDKCKDSHTYKKVKTTDATTSKDGKKYYECEYCGKEKTSTIYKVSKVYLSTTAYAYNGKAKNPSVKVYDSKGNKLTYGDDYTYSRPSSSKSIGRYKIAVTFKGDYTGTKNLYYTIGPKNTSSVKATLYGHDDVKVSWSKVSGASGYKVYYKKSTSSSWSSKTTTSTSTKLSNLSDGKKYDIKVVAYKTISGVKCYNSGKETSIYTLKKITGVKVAKSSSSVKVSWSNISGETGYQISKTTSKSKSDVVSTYKTTSGKSKTLSATKGKTYYYKVRAYKEVDGKKIYGPWSDPIKYVRK